MSVSNISRRERIKERNRKQKQRRNIKSIGIVIAGIVIIAVSLYWSNSQRLDGNEIDYSPEDIVYDQPLHAIHEMEGPNLASIPFLSDSGPQPQIEVSEIFYNFGSIGLTSVVTHEFVLANTGEAPLTISRVYTTCGCTTADFTGTLIPPGKVVLMTLTLDAGFHDVGGQTVRRGVIIENNDPDNPQLEIWTEASVRTSP